jgi:hypothetical protein
VSVAQRRMRSHLLVILMHRPAIELYRSAMRLYRSAIELHRSAMRLYRSAMALHRLAIQLHRVTMRLSRNFYVKMHLIFINEPHYNFPKLAVSGKSLKSPSTPKLKNSLYSPWGLP